MNVTFKKDEYVLLDDTNKIIANYIVTKGAKGDKGDGENNIIEDVKVNNNSLPVTSKSVNIDLTGYVEKETGKGLSTNDYTTAEKNKLAGIEASADVNVIENIKVNGVAQTVTNKAVDISVPINTSDLNNDSDFVTSTDLASHLVNVGTEVDEDYKVNFIHSKNLLDLSSLTTQTINGITYTKNSDGTITANGTASANASIILGKIKTDSSKSYSLSGCPSGGSQSTYTMYISGANPAINDFGSGVAINNKEFDNNLIFVVFSGKTVSNMVIKPMLNEGSSALPYEPYNISNQIVVDNETFTDTIKVSNEVDDKSRVNVLKSKNLLSTSLELGTYSNEGVKAGSTANYRNVNAIKVKPNTTYTFSINGVAQNYAVYLYNSSMTFLDSATTATFTTPANCEYLNFRCFNADFTSDFANLKVQLEEGSTATSYEPYVTPSINVDGEEIYKYEEGQGSGSIQGISVKYAKYNKIANISITGGNTSQLNATTFYDLQLPNNFKPIFEINDYQQIGSILYMYRITSDGVLRIYPSVNVSIGTQFRYSLTYITLD